MMFGTKEEMILWIVDTYYCSFMFMFSRLESLNNNRLAEEIEKITHGDIKLVIDNDKYILKNN